MPRFSLHLFGLPRLVVDGEPVAIQRKKTIALLSILAIDEQAYSRAFLSTLFWPRSSAPAAASNLRHALTMLRRALGTATIDADQAAVALRSDARLWVDVREFRRLVADGTHMDAPPGHSAPVIESAQLARWATAASLYTQDFLAGFALPDCPDYDAWQREQRTSLRHAALQILYHLARGYMDQQEHATALDYAARGLALEGTHEPIARVAMQIHAQLDDRAAVERIYRTLAANLRDQLGVEPDPRTRKLHAELLHKRPHTQTRSPAAVASHSPGQTRPTDGSKATAHPPLQVAPTTDLRKVPFQTDLSPLIGRDNVIADLNRLLDREGVRLVTLVGTGGVGKTRLAQQIAMERHTRYADGIVFVSLASIRAPHLVIHSIAQALRVHTTDSRSLAVVLHEYLQSRALCLILDNFEQVISAAPLLSEMLAAAPALQVLVTSREPLRIAGEILFQVLPLATPPATAIGHDHSDGATSPSGTEIDITASIYPSIGLFLHRMAAQPFAHQITKDAQAAIGAICARVDGIPLAIELAAAQTRLFTPQALLHRLQHTPVASSPLRLLRDTRRDRPQRQHSLWQTLDWSYQLLSAGEQGYLHALAVFAGGCTLESAHAVCCAGIPLLAGHTLDETIAHLRALVDKCLVVVNIEDDGNPRFSLLETVREYAGEQLQTTGAAAKLQELHARHYLALAEHAEPQLLGSEQGHWLDRLEQEHDNLRAVLMGWQDHPSADKSENAGTQPDEKASEKIDQQAIGPRLGAALWHFWYMRGHHSEGLEWLHQLVQEPLTPRLRAKLLYGMSMLTRRLREATIAVQYAQESLSLYRELDDRAGIASVLRVIGFLHYLLEDPQTARAELEESLALFQELQDEGGIAATLTNLSYVAALLNDLDAVHTYAEQSLAMRLATGNYYAASTTLAMLAMTALNQGANQRAADYAKQSLTICRQIGNQNGEGVAKGLLGHVALAYGNIEEAQVHFYAEYQIGQQTTDQELIARAAQNLGLLALHQNDSQSAASYLRQACEIEAQSGSPWKWIELCVPIAAFAQARSRPRLALRIASAILALQQRVSASFPLLPAYQQQWDLTVANARAQLDANEIEAAWQAGLAMTVEELIAVVEAMFAQL